MKYQVEFVFNEDCLCVHITKRITNRVRRESLGYRRDSFRTPRAKFVKELLKTKGIISVSFRDYQIHLEKGSAFSWTDLVPKVLASIGESFNTKMVQAAPPNSLTHCTCGAVVRITPDS